MSIMTPHQQHVDVDSMPVVSATITGDVSVTQSTSPWVVSFGVVPHVIIDSGAVAVTQTTSPWVVSFGATPQHVIIDSGSVNATVTGTVTANIAGSIGNTSFDATQGTTPWLTAFNLPTTAQTTRALIDHAASGDNTIIAGTALQTIRIWKIFFVCDDAVNVYFRDGTAGAALTGTMKFGAGGSFVLDLDGDPWFVTTAGNAFVVNLSAAVGIRGRIYYSKS